MVYFVSGKGKRMVSSHGDCFCLDEDSAEALLDQLVVDPAGLHMLHRRHSWLVWLHLQQLSP